MNKNYYFVSFSWYDSGLFCSNIALAENKEIVKEYYETTYGWCSVGDVLNVDEIKEAQKKGMPVIEL